GGASFESIIVKLKETFMSSFIEKDQDTTTTEQSHKTTSVPFPEPVSQELPVPQLPFPDAPQQAIFQNPGVTRPLTNPPPAPTVTRQLESYTPPALTTHVLPDLQTGTLPGSRNPTTSLRQPVVIR